MECRTMLFDTLPKLRRQNFGCSLLNWSGHKNAIEKIFTIVFFLNLPGTYDMQAQRLSRDQEIGLLTNQVGYMPSSIKTCLVRGTEKRDFEVREITSDRVAYRGTLIPQHNDFGAYATADFSKLVKEGRYYLRADTLRSFPFSISSFVYHPQTKVFITYDDERSIREKCVYIKKNKLAGAMFWEYEDDKKEYLLDVIAREFNY